MPSGNPFDVPTGAPQAAPSAPTAAVTPKGNPFDVGGNTPVAPSSAPTFARTPTTNPIINALDASRRFGKHFAATGHLGLPDQAGSDADQAIISKRMLSLNEPLNHLPEWLRPKKPIFGDGSFQSDYAFDPLLGVPAGKLAEGTAWLAKGGMDAARPLGRFVPQAVQEAAGTVGNLAREGAGNIRDLFRWGGKDAGKIPPDEYRSAILSSNREGVMQTEEARRHTAALAGIFAGLSDAQRLDAYRVLKGEVDVASDPAVMAAARKARAYLDTNYYLKANAAGRTRVALGNQKVGNAGLKDASRARPAAAPRKLDPFEQAVPEGEGAPLPRHPDLPANGRSPLHLRGGEAGINRASPALQKQYAVPDEFREFVPPAKQGALGPLEYKPHYFPGLHRPPEIVDPKARPEPYNRLFPSTPEALHQRPWSIGKGELDEEGKPKLAMLDESMARSGKSTAKQTAAARLRESLGLSLGPQDASKDPLIKLFEHTPEAKGAARTLPEHIAGAMRVPADAARASLIALGLVHGGKNVPTLATLSEPKALGGMLADAVRTMRMTPEQKWEAQRAAREAGVLAPGMDHDNPVLRVAGKTPALVRTGLGALYGGWRGQDLEDQMNPQGNLAERIAGGALGAGSFGLLGHFLPQVGKGVGGFTQAMDDAGKANVYAAKLAKGMKPAEAAADTLHETIDYAHRTPAADWLQHWGLAPFAQFATKVPGAVARSVARDPRKLLLADRLTGGLATTGSIDLPQQPLNDQGKPAQFSLANPLSETLKAATDPLGYARTKSSDLAKAAASIVSAALGGNVGNAFTGTDRKGKRDPRALYPTHGQPLLPHKNKLGKLKAGFLGESLAHLAPFGIGAEALDATGGDEYQRESPLSQIFGPIIGGYVR